MTPARFRAVLTTLRWSRNELIRLLDRDQRMIRRWSSGAMMIPADIAAWLETLAAAHEANPPPPKRAHQEATDRDFELLA